MKGFMYILKCVNTLYYVGSTNNLVLRMREHAEGRGANFTRKYLPFKLVYYEEYDRIDEAYARETQLHGWSRKKKEALINSCPFELPLLSQCQNFTHFHFKEIREQFKEEDEQKESQISDSSIFE